VTGGVRIHLRQNGESHEPDLGVTPSHHRASIRHPARTAELQRSFMSRPVCGACPNNPEARSYLRSTTKAIVTLYGFVLAVAFRL
jgi:hypothetical protein